MPQQTNIFSPLEGMDSLLKALISPVFLLFTASFFVLLRCVLAPFLWLTSANKD
jgi:hypothetical protein